jgi:hypothetical protein
VKVGKKKACQCTHWAQLDMGVAYGTVLVNSARLVVLCIISQCGEDLLSSVRQCASASDEQPEGTHLNLIGLVQRNHCRK